MQIQLRLQRMDNGDIVVYTKTGDSWIQHGHWPSDPKVVVFESVIEVPPDDILNPED